MKARTISGCLILSMMLCHSSFGVVALQISYQGTTDVNEPEVFSVTTRDCEGNITEKIFDPSEFTSTIDSYSPDPYLIDCSPYEPSNWQDEVSPLSIDADGREKQTKVNLAIGTRIHDTLYTYISNARKASEERW